MRKRFFVFSGAVFVVLLSQATSPAFCQFNGIINDAKNLGKTINNAGKQPQSTGTQPKTASQTTAPSATASSQTSQGQPIVATTAPNPTTEAEEYTDYRNMPPVGTVRFINEHLRGKMSATQQAHWDQIYAVYWNATGTQPIIKEHMEAIAKEGVTGELADALAAVWDKKVQSGYSKMFPEAYRFDKLQKDDLIAYITDHLMDKTTGTQKAMWQQYLLDRRHPNEGTFRDLDVEDLRAIAREGLPRDLHEALHSLCGGSEGGDKFLPKKVDSDDLLKKYSALPKSDEFDRKKAIIDMAGIHDSRVIQQLLSSLASEPSRDVRLMAVRALVGVADPKVSDALIRAVKTDQSTDVRQRSLWALFIIGDTHTKEIATLMMEDEDSKVAELANSILNKMAGTSPEQTQELAKQRSLARQYDVSRLLPLGIREKAPEQQQLFASEMQKALVSASAAGSLPNVIAKKAKVQEVRDAFLVTFQQKIGPTKLDDWVGQIYIEGDRIGICIDDVDLGYVFFCPLEGLKDKSQILTLADKDWVVFSAAADPKDVNVSRFLANVVNNDGHVDLGQNFITWNNITLTKLRKIEASATKP